MKHTTPFSDLRNSGQVRVVSISDMAASDQDHEVLITYSLGSCVGLSVYDPVARVGGLIHCMLPLSRLDPEKAKSNPYMFVDTGVCALLQEVFKKGANRRTLVAKVAGGSQILDQRGLFDTGWRNYLVLRKILWKNDILIKAEDVGGVAVRTMALYMATGVTTIRIGGKETEF